MNYRSQREFFNHEVAQTKLSDYIAAFKNPTLASRYQQETLFNILSAHRGDRVLELGTGYGQWAIPLLSSGVNVTALDISEKSLEVCNKIFSSLKTKEWGKLEIIVGDIEKINLEGSYDKVFCVNFLHHIKNPQQIIEKMVSFVKDGGDVVCLEPNLKTPLWYLYFRWVKKSWHIEKGLKNTELELMLNYFQRAGLKCILIKKFGIIPLRLLNFSSLLQSVNFKIAERLSFYMFHIIKGTKKENEIS
jgi:2-polyprenyl-3-methyl-5-hydroxy-6-metoxy-1,4-benzoquinol methylase